MKIDSMRRIANGCTLRGFILLPLFLALSGCQTLSYQEPKTGDHARVRFAVNTDTITVLYGYAGQSCSGNEQEWMRLKTGGLLVGSSKLLGIPLNQHGTNAAKEIYVPVDKPLHLLFKATSGVAVMVNNVFIDTLSNCGVAIDYQFEKDKDYEVFFDWSKNRCEATISLVDLNKTPSMQVIKNFDYLEEAKDAGCFEKFTKYRFN